MSKIFSFLFILVIITNGAKNSFSQSNWQTYPYSPAGSVLSFPNDDGNHTGVSTKTEWWYVNLHLVGSAPQFKKYDVMLCYFTTGSMRIFNISESSGTFHTNVLQAYPTFVSQPNKWDLTYTVPLQVNDYSHWTYPTSNKTFQYVFHAEEPGKNDLLNVTVTSNRLPLIVGKNGFVALGDKGDSSFYYSVTNMNVTGTIKYNGVTDNITSGIAWIDRQYGPFTVGVNTNNKYEWFSFQADKPGSTLGIPQTASEFNIWQIFSDTSSIPYKPEWRMVSEIFPDDTQDTSCSYFFERTGYWYDAANKKYYSQGWRFIDPKHGVNLDMTPNIPNQVINVTLFKFWEGGATIKGTVNDQATDGVGFAELVADHITQIILPSVPAGLTVTPLSNYYSLAWLASVAGTYPVGGYRIFRSQTNDGHWQYIASTANLNYDDHTALPATAYYYTVTSFDNQTATSASDYAAAVFANALGENELSVNGNQFFVYPNPTSGKINLKMNVPISIGIENLKMKSIEIYNIYGERIFSAADFHSDSYRDNTSSNYQIDLSLKPNGIYFLRLSTEKEIVAKKIVLSK